MFEELKDENIIVNIENLVKQAHEPQDDLSEYVMFMRDEILCVNGLN